MVAPGKGGGHQLFSSVQYVIKYHTGGWALGAGCLVLGAGRWALGAMCCRCRCRCRQALPLVLFCALLGSPGALLGSPGLSRWYYGLSWDILVLFWALLGFHGALWALMGSPGALLSSAGLSRCCFVLSWALPGEQRKYGKHTSPIWSVSDTVG